MSKERVKLHKYDDLDRYDLEVYTNNLEEQINKALDIAFKYAQIDGSHHKMWVIDQMLRELLKDDYKMWVEKYMFDGKDPVEAVQTEEYYNWDTGIEP